MFARILLLSAVLGLALVAVPLSPVAGTAEASLASCTWTGEPGELVDSAECTARYTLNCVEGIVEDGACPL